jgi:hypothetical protein
MGVIYFHLRRVESPRIRVKHSELYEVPHEAALDNRCH